jgi:hypothetical protein
MIDDIVEELIVQAEDEELTGLACNLRDLEVEEEKLLAEKLSKTIVEWMDEIKI